MNNILRPILRPILTPTLRAVTDALAALGRLIRPGDYITDELGNRLTDELANQLTG